METVTAQGISGKTYNYFVSSIEAGWQAVPVNYMFASRGIGGWRVLYVGEADDARSRFSSHERWEEAVRHGATHILNHVAVSDQATRRTEERDLIQSLNPPMNTHHMPSKRLGGLG